MSDTTPVVEPAAPEAPKPTAPAAPEPVATAPEAASSTEPAVWDTPETAKAEIERLRRENAKDRTTAKQTAADEARDALVKTLGKTLGFVKDDEPMDPATFTEKLTTSQTEAQCAKVELAVFRNAGTAGADPNALLDSASFLAKVQALDPSDSTAIAAAITDAIEANPRLKAVAVELPVISPDPGLGTSGGGSPTPKSAAQQIADAEADGDWKKANALRANALIELRKQQG